MRRCDNSAILVVPNVTVRMEAQLPIPTLNLCDLLWASFYMRKELFNCSEWPDLISKKQFVCPLPCETADGEAIGHPVCLMHIAQVMVRLHHNRWFYCIPLVIAEITFCWCTMDIHQHLNVSLIPPQYFCHITLFHFLSVWGIPFMFGVTIPHQFFFFSLKSPCRSWRKRNCPFTIFDHILPLSESVLSQACIALKCCAMHCLFFPKYTFMSQVV